MATKPTAPTAPLVDLPSRRIIVFSFWAILLLGLPFWWYTTTIERLALPKGQVSGTSYERCQLPGVSTLAEGEPVSDPSEFSDLSVPVATEQTLIKVAKTLLDLGSTAADSRVAKFAPRYKLVFSLLNQDSSTGAALLEWEIQALLNRHLRPLLSSLAPLHTFEIETQIQYFAPLSINLGKDDDGIIIQEDDLRAFVNSADWNLPTSVTLDPVLHFMLFVPSLENRPMRISTSRSKPSSNAFITPQRGGVVIFNPPSPSSADEPSSPLSLAADSFAPSFQLFEQQLRKLLGVPPPPRSARYGRTGALEGWQVDAMVRTRLAEATKESVDTLHAIVKLVDDIPNMRVGKEVQRGVYSALRELDQARAILPTSPSRALSHAASALSLASKAYYDPTMLALLYFPDEHKYAIYTPLFGPVAVPMVVALMKEWKEWKERRRRKKAAEGAPRDGEKDKVE
ncbi:phosphatidylinositol-glycan biosynthesis class S protein-domain-containing protein [Leucosporidium creatinivorum]|uniref:Phosphatidylinositol-glycan biosynthesis class S protein-domain-containing protein n=1 Tax=Leucosporidium creatinivorum TaxID=106004 RepID=A0A1Y2G484_9BASI|nr:phosphatidylinositol-glycan biosynthesis class S protein-domain-containing protein [Leucosporidium creatinivorum]